MNIGIFYGSSTGYTQDVAERIANLLGVSRSNVHNVSSSLPSDVGAYDLLLLGSSTWGVGDLQDDWYDFMNGLEIFSLKDKVIAIFGCGDETMSDSFCGAIGEIYKRLQATGAHFIGFFNADGYSFNTSPAFINGNYVGMLLDEVNHPELTNDKLLQWTKQVIDEYNQKNT